MNHLVIITVALICLSIGWFIGNYQASKMLDDMENALGSIEKTPAIVNGIHLHQIRAQGEINLLTLLQNEQYDMAKKHLVESLRGYYHGQKETAADNMATDVDLETVNKIELLAKENSIFKEVMRQ